MWTIELGRVRWSLPGNFGRTCPGSSDKRFWYPRIEIRGRWLEFVISRCFYKNDVFRFRKYYQRGPDVELEFGFLRSYSQYTFICGYKYQYTVYYIFFKVETGFYRISSVSPRKSSMSQKSRKNWCKTTWLLGVDEMKILNDKSTYFIFSWTLQFCIF